MHGADTIRQVERLLAVGYTQRRVSLLTGVSRGTVASVARGEFTADDRHEPEAEIPHYIAQRGPRHRCAECGGLVYGECLKCQIERDRPRHLTYSLQPQPLPPAHAPLPARAR